MSKRESLRVKPTRRNVVIIEARDYKGQILGYPFTVHDGTMEGMVKSAMWLSSTVDYQYGEVSHINSRIFGIDGEGKRFTISPNGCHVAELGTDESRYILGDLSRGGE